MNCAFCGRQEIQKRVIVENNLAFAFPTNIPIVPGHILVCPKRHIQLYGNVSHEEREAIEELRINIITALRKVFGAEGFNFAWNEGEVGGQSVPHLHLHIVPRTKGDAGIYRYEPREFLYRPGIRAQRPKKELEDIAQSIQRALM